SRPHRNSPYRATKDGRRAKSGERWAPGLSDLVPAEITSQRLRDLDRAVLALVVLQNRDERPPDRQRRAVQRMDELGFFSFRAAKPDLRAARLKVGAIRARRDFFETILSGQPHFEIVRLRGGKPEIARRQRGDAIVEPELPQRFLGVGRQKLVSFPGF